MKQDDVILLLILVVCLMLILYFAKRLLKADNSFYYRNGRSMRGLDILLAIDEDKFNYRVQNLSEPTRPLFDKWVRMDIWLAPAFNIFVTVLLIFVERAYHHAVFNIFFTTLMIGQIVALVCHALSDMILLQSLKRQEMTANMQLFNTLVIIKMIFPVLGVFISFATLILVWFRLLNSLNTPFAAIMFFVPAALIFFGVKIFKGKPKAELQ
ncbi:MAG: hypothetical protein ACXWV4_03425 [Flavitalea sp.]